jgi:hypothetical protein
MLKIYFEKLKKFNLNVFIKKKKKKKCSKSGQKSEFMGSRDLLFSA